MTFTEIVTEVADRMNLTSATALTRIGRSINERYRWMASSVGFDTIERGVALAATVIGSQYATFGLLPAITPVTVQKLLSVYNANVSPFRTLDQITFDTMRNQPAMTGDTPQQYAISLMGSTTVQVFLDSKAATIYNLSADVLTNLVSLSGTNVPAFAEDFHDALIYGAMATELDKMEKYDLAAKKEAQFEGRVSDLRMFIAKSAYLTIHQGRRRVSPSTNSQLV